MASSDSPMDAGMVVSQAARSAGLAHVLALFPEALESAFEAAQRHAAGLDAFVEAETPVWCEAFAVTSDD